MPSRSTAVAEQTTAGDDLPWYRKEGWLAIQAVALVPILGAMFVPANYRLPLCILGGALIAIGTVMMFRQHASVTATRQRTTSEFR